MQIRDFLKYVLPDVPGCPMAVAKQAALDAATTFLTESQAWTEVQYPFDLVSNQQEYDLEAPPGATCIDITEIYLRSGKLIGVTIEQLARIMPDWQTAAGNVPTHYTRAHDFTSFKVYPLPTNPGSEQLTVHAVYTLKDTATTIPDDIVRRYREPIASGAKARLMVMPKTQWQDLKLADFHMRQFESGKSGARITAAHAKTRGATVVLPRRFGR